MIDHDGDIKRIDDRLERMEEKLDRALSLQATVDYLKYAIVGAWVGLLALFGVSK